jgi:DNA invertase Pin-like site-specific DNA recombinase
MLIGYARISTAEQKLDLQLDALHQAGCEQIFHDVMTSTRLDLSMLKSGSPTRAGILVQRVTGEGRAPVPLIRHHHMKDKPASQQDARE